MRRIRAPDETFHSDITPPTGDDGDGHRLPHAVPAPPIALRERPSTRRARSGPESVFPGQRCGMARLRTVTIRNSRPDGQSRDGSPVTAGAGSAA